MNASVASPPAGFYETFRTSGGRPHHWRFNRARLTRACAQIGHSLLRDCLALDDVRLRAAVREQLKERGESDAVFRYSLDFTATPPEQLVARTLPLPAPQRGVALRVLQTAREPAALSSRPKILRDPTIIAAAAELDHRVTAPSDEGLLLAVAGGQVVETTRQCVFWIEAGEIFFPAPELGGVAGTGWAWLLANGLAAHAVAAPLDTLVRADAVAVCNSVRGVTPVAELWDISDRAVLRRYESATHPLIQSLAASWRESLARTAAGEDA